MPVFTGTLRATGRKAANAIRSTNPADGFGSGGTSRALHLAAPISPAQPSLGQTIVHSLESIRPRNQLFTSTRNFVTTIFTRLSAPGVRVPRNIPHSSSRVLQSGSSTPSIRSGLSLPARHALHSKAFGAGTFLPRAPMSPRPPVATQLGLGTARNFSSSRPIFQNLVDNVPIALRSLYEADLDIDFARKKTGVRRPLYTALNKPKAALVGPKMKPRARRVLAEKENSEVLADAAAEFSQYFSAPTPAPVTSYVFIPLAPTPSNRLPLSSRDSLPHTGRFIPLGEVGSIHASHSRHALRVSTLFAKLDQANVWSHPGVSCTPYSGCPRKALSDDDDEELEGVCTFLKLEFAGWTMNEVRSVIGECGQGWCVFEEVRHDEEEDEESVFSSAISSPPSELVDPAQSMVMPTIDFSSSFLAGQNAFAEESQRAPQEELAYEDPWTDDLGSESSFEFDMDRIIDPPSENGWFSMKSSTSFSHISFEEVEGPREHAF